MTITFGDFTHNNIVSTSTVWNGNEARLDFTFECTCRIFGVDYVIWYNFCFQRVAFLVGTWWKWWKTNVNKERSYFTSCTRLVKAAFTRIVKYSNLESIRRVFLFIISIYCQTNRCQPKTLLTAIFILRWFKKITVRLERRTPINFNFGTEINQTLT